MVATTLSLCGVLFATGIFFALALRTLAPVGLGDVLSSAAVVLFFANMVVLFGGLLWLTHKR